MQVAAERRSVLLPALASLALRLTGLASSFALGVLLARRLGPAEFGAYGLVISVSAMLFTIGLLGTPQLAVRQMAARTAAGDGAGARRMAGSFLLVTTIAALAAGIVALPAMLTLFAGRADAWVLALLAIGMGVALTVTVLVAAMLRGLGALFRGQVMDIAGRPIAALVVLAALVTLGWPIAAKDAVIVQVAVALVAAVVSLAWIRGAVGPLRLGERGWLGAALPLGLVDLLRQLDGTYGLFLLGYVASDEALGIYRVALSTAALVAMPVTILHVTLAPQVARLHHLEARAELQALLKRASAMMVAALVPMLLGLLLFGRWLVTLVFGPVYADAWLPLALLCAGQVAFALFGMGPILLAMTGGERELTRIYLIAVGSGVLAALVLVPRWGAAGAGAAQLLSSAMIAAASGRHARRVLGLETTFLSRAAPHSA